MPVCDGGMAVLKPYPWMDRPGVDRGGHRRGPALLVGYIALVEGGILRRVLSGERAVRPWLWLGPALAFLGVFLVYPTIEYPLELRTGQGNDFVGLTTTHGSSPEGHPDRAANNALWVVLLPYSSRDGPAVRGPVDRVRYESAVKSVVFRRWRSASSRPASSGGSCTIKPRPVTSGR